MANPTVWDQNGNMPAINPIGLRYHQARVFLLIFAIVTSAYLLTYRARIESGDTLRAMDALTSQSRFGDWLMDESTWFKPPLRVREHHNLPLSGFDVEERLQLNLALPLLQLAEFLPRMGNIHVVWLFNILVTGLMAGLITLILRAFGYADMVGIVCGLECRLRDKPLGIQSNVFPRIPNRMLYTFGALSYARQQIQVSPSANLWGHCWICGAVSRGRDQILGNSRATGDRHICITKAPFSGNCFD